MTGLPPIGGPAMRALAGIGVTTLEQAARLSEAEMLALHGLGPKAVGLLKAALAAEGSPDAGSGPHRFSVRVYFEDTDFSGVVYHTAYLHYMERARTEFLRAIGVHHSELIARGVFFAVRSMQIDFDAAARIDDLLEVETRVESVTAARLTLDQRILRDGATITRARVLAVAVTTAGRPSRMPRSILGRFGTAGAAESNS